MLKLNLVFKKRKAVYRGNEWGGGPRSSFGFYDLVQNAASLWFLIHKIRTYSSYTNMFFSGPNFSHSEGVE